jgi:CubicO group peptidase (beta-lactamase class C family)
MRLYGEESKMNPIALRQVSSLTLVTLIFLAGCRAEQSAIPWPEEIWATSTPAAEGINSEAIESLVVDLESGEYGLVDAFMLIRNGKVVADYRFTHDYAAIGSEYDTTNHQYNYDHPDWHPYLRDTDLHTLQSVTKSITSIALGIAIDKKLLGGVDTPVMPFFETYSPYVTDARKESTTLEDFLTMRSGIQWNTEGAYGSGIHSTDLLEASDEWIRFVLDQPTDTTPGSRYEYNDGVSVLLGKIMREATGKRMDEWAQEHLFKPIGIEDFYWKITPDGEADTEGGLYLTTEDLARIGYLLLRGGEWNGLQVVSSEWVEASTAAVVADIAPENDRPDAGYGYQWWIPDAENGVTQVFAGNGYGGQFLLVSPAHDIVAVFNGWNIHGGGNRSTWRALQERILPHVDSIQ